MDKIFNVRAVIGNVLIALVLIFAVNVSVVMIHRIHTVSLKDIYQNIFYHELFVFVILLLFALDVRFCIFSAFRPRLFRIAGWIFRIIVVAVTCVFLFCCGNILSGCLLNTASEADYAIVLGMALENGKPTKDLLCRIDKAQQYLEENPGAVLILTGGNPDSTGKTEAAAMSEILSERGISDCNLVLEDKAKSTSENFFNTAKMLNPADPVVLISSNYHMARAVRTAEDAGFTHILQLPAPSDPLCFASNMMWEIITSTGSILK